MAGLAATLNLEFTPAEMDQIMAAMAPDSPEKGIPYALFAAAATDYVDDRDLHGNSQKERGHAGDQAVATAALRPLLEERAFFMKLSLLNLL